MSQRSVEMEKCKAPSICGRTIEYPEFKRSWNKVARVPWDDDTQIEQMKGEVDVHTGEIIQPCKDMAEVWAELDKEYGEEQQVANVVS